MFSSIEFFIVEAWTSLRRSGIMSVVAVGIITVSLTIFGAFLILVTNFGSIIGTVGSRLEVVAYVERDLPLADVNAIELKLLRITGVENVNYLSKNDAWEKFKSDFGERLNLGETVAQNPLPNTFIIKVRTADLISEVADKISKMSDIDEVRFSGKLVEQVQALASAVRIGGLTLVLLLSFATLLIVVNTVRLTVLARDTDIYIMRLVGATDAFIKGPFIIEGIIVGIIGSVLSILVLFITYEAVIVEVEKALPFLPLVSPNKIYFVYLILSVVGILLPMLGGYISVSKSLKE